MAYKHLISKGAYNFPQPSTYIGITATLVDSARNIGGFVVGSVIREDVAKVDATYRYITAADWSAILKLFNSTYGGSFFSDITFFNQLKNDWETRKMYIGDRTTGGAFKLDPDTGAVIGWEGAVLSLVEV